MLIVLQNPRRLKKDRQKRNIEKYGVDNPAKSDVIKNKIKQNNLVKYGVDNPAKSTVIKDKIRKNYYGDAVFNIANDKDKLKSIILGIKPEFRTIKNIGLSIGLDNFNYQWIRVLYFLEKYDYLEDKELNIIKNTTNHSEPELEIKKYIEEDLGIKCSSSRTVLDGKEIDIYIPEKKIGIEFNGDYFHSIEKVPKNYHFNKSKLAQEKGIRLIHIYQCEWNNPITREKIKELLRISVGKTKTKIYARDCEIKQISNVEAKDFNNKNHLQGHRNAKITYGLFYNNNLVQLMSFSHNRKYEWEIIRGCPASNNVVVGGVSKLFKHFIQDYKPNEIFSYCDFNKFDGKGYENIGMKFIGYTGPDKFYSINGLKVPRNHHRRKELEETSDFIIYGAGSKKYLWKDNNIL